MFHPLIKMLVSRPEMLAEHAGAYAELAAAEASQAVDQARNKAIAGAAAGVLALVGLVLAGVAARRGAAVATAAMPAPWLLVVVPALPLAAAIGAVLWLRSRPAVASFALLREQMAQDSALIQEAHT
jgi:cytochrome bd-type quinol oxidase subunit 2